jgi:deazaflavin-dependent oxidoreductase (nitroreductase family)
MPLPRWLARLNLRVTNRILGPVAKHAPGMGIVIHQGRKTNRRYRTPVMVFRHGDDLVVALTYGPDSQWVQNVLAHGGCDFESHGRTFHLTQPRLIHDERRSLVPAGVRLALAVLNASDFLELSLSG